MPIFTGYTTPRYQIHDVLISKLVTDFNQNKSIYIGVEVTKNIPDLTESLVKSWIIQESGGNDPRSRQAWIVDPAQVNVPGDWSVYKQSIGLESPIKRNEGKVEQNLKAAIMWLARKGFGKSGQPVSNRSAATFDGWKVAFQRYNGRTVITNNGKSYNTNYSDRIIERSSQPAKHVPIELPKP